MYMFPKDRYRENAQKSCEVEPQRLYFVFEASSQPMILCGRLMSFELLLWNIIRALSPFAQMMLQSQLGNTPAYYFPGIWEFRELLKGKLYSFGNKAECSCSLHMNSTNGINVNFIEHSKIVVIITPVKYSTREKRWRIVSQCFILSTQRILEKIQKWVWEKKTQ